MRIDPLKVRMAAAVSGMNTSRDLAKAAKTTNAVISTLYSGGHVTLTLVPRLAVALGVREVEIVSDDAEFTANLATLQAWRNAGCPAQPILVATVVS